MKFFTPPAADRKIGNERMRMTEKREKVGWGFALKDGSSVGLRGGGGVDDIVEVVGLAGVTWGE